jgi:RecB family exonuclease
MTLALPVVNEHLSFSRVKRYAQCPKSYELHYLQQAPSTPNDSLKFGKLLHAALESTYRQILAERLQGRFPLEILLVAYRREWQKSGLSGFAVFQEGFQILKSYAAAHPRIDYTTVLAIEQEFRLAIDRFEVLGYIDRVDRIDEETVEILDYKSNRLLFSREDVDADLQLSIYAIAARSLWPWAKTVRLRFYMLRHGVSIETTRTKQDLDAAREYIVTLGQQMESAEEFPPRLNPNCIYCDHSAHCPEYARALRGERKDIAASDDDLEAVGRERKELASILKILGSRKDKIDKLLKARLDEVEMLELAGVRYSMLPIAKPVYPTRKTLELMGEAVGLQALDIADRIATIQNDELRDLLRELEKRLPRHEHALLRANLEAIAERELTQRLVHKEVR